MSKLERKKMQDVMQYNIYTKVNEMEKTNVTETNK